MTLEEQIFAAFRDHLETPDLTSPATPIAWPMVNYAPAANVAYLDVRPMLRADPQNPWIGADSPTVYRGVLQIDVVVPKDGSGEGAANRLAPLVRERFRRGTNFDLADGRLQILQMPMIAAAVPDGTWLRYPVSIPWFIAA